MTKKKNKRKSTTSTKSKKVTKSEASEPKWWTPITGWLNKNHSSAELAIIALVITCIHFAYSTLSTGWYQGEEAIHYLNMKEFWHNPNCILGNWAKPGWKIVYVLPALAGSKFLVLFNSFIAALCAIMAYRLVQLLGGKFPIMAIVLLTGQFFWMEMAFRNYSEFIAALALVTGVYLHYRGRFALAALMCSYLIIVRQEIAPICALYGLYLLYHRRWLPVVLVAVFPFIINLWGYLVNGDPLYFINNAIGISSSYSDLYPRHGFQHYFLVATPVFGVLTVMGFLLYLNQVLSKKIKPHWFVIIPAVGLFFLLCLFQLQAYKILTSTAGNWRYLLVISPLLAVLAALGWAKSEEKPKWLNLSAFLIYLLLAFKFMPFGHNYILFKENIPNPILPIIVFVSVGFYIFPKPQKMVPLILLLLQITFNTFYLKPIQIGQEDKTMKEIAAWSEENNIDDQPIICANPLLKVFWDRLPQQFPNGLLPFKKEEVSKAPVGTYIYWDSHYTVRSSQLNYDYFTSKPDVFELVKQQRADDNTFLILIFKKIGELNE